ncbi:carbohydrate ABC transporter permease [Cohnella hongkongensis]|uniref:Carbohydrate ABC transporter permease n=1 Tax=Cohnella hongkongensis TaxID=178337 RepID=A0ABV9FDM3_9BACL
MRSITPGKAAVYVLLAIGAIPMFFPFFWMFISSVKTAVEVNTTPPTFWPSVWSLDNYAYAFNKAPFGTYFLNSVIVSTVNVGLTVCTTILAAFAFSRLRFPGRDLLFALLLSLMMIPFEMLVITNYTTIANWQLIDTLSAMILPFTSNIFYTFILRNFFLSIPDSLYRSARIDGAGHWKYLWRIMVPIARPALVTIVLLNAISSWNSFLWPLLVTNSTQNRTLPFGLYAFISESGIRYELLMAASTIVVLPMMLLFLFMRRSIVTSVAHGGIKG